MVPMKGMRFGPGGRGSFNCCCFVISITNSMMVIGKNNPKVHRWINPNIGLISMMCVIFVETVI